MTKVTGILYLGEGLLNLNNTSYELTPLSVGRLILKRQMKKEGYSFNPVSRTKWLQSEMEYMNEISDDMGNEITHITEMIDYYVDNLLHCNAPHIIGINNTQVSSEYVNEVNDALVNMLEDENAVMS